MKRVLRSLYPEAFGVSESVFSVCSQSEEERLKDVSVKVFCRLHWTEAIINMQPHLHATAMIRDVSSWTIKFPKVPLARLTLRTSCTCILNHSVSVRAKSLLHLYIELWKVSGAVSLCVRACPV